MSARYVAIVGSRRYNDAEDYRICRYIEKLPRHTVIVTGCAEGADASARRWGRHFGHVVVECKANWLRFGKNAGPPRNTVIAEIASRVVAFFVPGAENVGTTDCCNQFRDRGKPVDEHH